MAPDSVPPPTDDPEPPYRDIRRWCIQIGRPISASDLVREYRLGWNRANALLEELEADAVLRSFAEGGRRLWIAGEVPAAPDRPTPSTLRAPRRFRRGTRTERCAVCDWFIPDALGTTETRGIHRHHIVPLSCGGPDEPSNLIELCPSHHALVHILWTRTGGRYAGPRTHANLIEAVRFAEADPEEFARRRRLEASSSLDLGRPRQASPPQPHQAPPLRGNAVAARHAAEELPRREISPAAKRRHRRERHGCAIKHCSRCAAAAAAERLPIEKITPALTRHHLRENHRGPIATCPNCIDAQKKATPPGIRH